MATKRESQLAREQTFLGVPYSEDYLARRSTETFTALRGGSGDPGAVAILDPVPTSSSPELLELAPVPGVTEPLTIQPQGGSMSLAGPLSPIGGGSPSFSTGLTGIDIGPGGISAEGSLFGVPISATIPLGSSGGGEAPSSGSVPELAGSRFTNTTQQQQQCPGIGSIYVPGVGCVNPADALPGGDPFVTGPTSTNGNGKDGFGPARIGRYGEGRVPRVEVQTVRRCPPKYALGDDGICYRNLGRNSPKRAWPMGMKPLLTPGDRAAIKKAKSAATKLARSKKSLRQASRALEKAGC